MPGSTHATTYDTNYSVNEADSRRVVRCQAFVRAWIARRRVARTRKAQDDDEAEANRSFWTESGTIQDRRPPASCYVEQLRQMEATLLHTKNTTQQSQEQLRKLQQFHALHQHVVLAEEVHRDDVCEREERTRSQLLSDEADFRQRLLRAEEDKLAQARSQVEAEMLQWEREQISTHEDWTRAALVEELLMSRFEVVRTVKEQMAEAVALLPFQLQSDKQAIAMLVQEARLLDAEREMLATQHREANAESLRKAAQETLCRFQHEVTQCEKEHGTGHKALQQLEAVKFQLILDDWETFLWELVYHKQMEAEEDNIALLEATLSMPKQPLSTLCCSPATIPQAVLWSNPPAADEESDHVLLSIHTYRPTVQLPCIIPIPAVETMPLISPELFRTFEIENNVLPVPPFMVPPLQAPEITPIVVSTLATLSANLPQTPLLAPPSPVDRTIPEVQPTTNDATSSTIRIPKAVEQWLPLLSLLDRQKEHSEETLQHALLADVCERVLVEGVLTRHTKYFTRDLAAEATINLDELDPLKVLSTIDELGWALASASLWDDTLPIKSLMCEMARIAARAGRTAMGTLQPPTSTDVVELPPRSTAADTQPAQGCPQLPMVVTCAARRRDNIPIVTPQHHLQLQRPAVYASPGTHMEPPKAQNRSLTLKRCVVPGVHPKKLVRQPLKSVELLHRAFTQQGVCVPPARSIILLLKAAGLPTLPIRPKANTLIVMEEQATGYHNNPGGAIPKSSVQHEQHCSAEHLPPLVVQPQPVPPKNAPQQQQPCGNLLLACKALTTETNGFVCPFVGLYWVAKVAFPDKHWSLPPTTTRQSASGGSLAVSDSSSGMHTTALMCLHHVATGDSIPPTYSELVGTFSHQSKLRQFKALDIIGMVHAEDILSLDGAGIPVLVSPFHETITPILPPPSSAPHPKPPTNNYKVHTTEDTQLNIQPTTDNLIDSIEAGEPTTPTSETTYIRTPLLNQPRGFPNLEKVFRVHQQTSFMASPTLASLNHAASPNRATPATTISTSSSTATPVAGVASGLTHLIHAQDVVHTVKTIDGQQERTQTLGIDVIKLLVSPQDNPPDVLLLLEGHLAQYHAQRRRVQTNRKLMQDKEAQFTHHLLAQQHAHQVMQHGRKKEERERESSFEALSEQGTNNVGQSWNALVVASSVVKVRRSMNLGGIRLLDDLMRSHTTSQGTASPLIKEAKLAKRLCGQVKRKEQMCLRQRKQTNNYNPPLLSLLLAAQLDDCDLLVHTIKQNHAMEGAVGLGLAENSEQFAKFRGIRLLDSVVRSYQRTNIAKHRQEVPLVQQKGSVQQPEWRGLSALSDLSKETIAQRTERDHKQAETQRQKMRRELEDINQARKRLARLHDRQQRIMWQESAATTIQSCWKGYEARKLLELEKKSLQSEREVRQKKKQISVEQQLKRAAGAEAFRHRKLQQEAMEEERARKQQQKQRDQHGEKRLALKAKKQSPSTRTTKPSTAPLQPPPLNAFSQRQPVKQRDVLTPNVHSLVALPPGSVTPGTTTMNSNGNMSFNLSMGFGNKQSPTSRTRRTSKQTGTNSLRHIRNKEKDNNGVSSLFTKSQYELARMRNDTTLINTATTIQAWWRGNRIRLWYTTARILLSTRRLRNPDSPVYDMTKAKLIPLPKQPELNSPRSNNNNGTSTANGTLSSLQTPQQHDNKQPLSKADGDSRLLRLQKLVGYDFASPTPPSNMTGKETQLPLPQQQQGLNSSRERRSPDSKLAATCTSNNSTVTLTTLQRQHRPKYINAWASKDTTKVKLPSIHSSSNNTSSSIRDMRSTVDATLSTPCPNKGGTTNSKKMALKENGPSVEEDMKNTLAFISKRDHVARRKRQHLNNDDDNPAESAHAANIFLAIKDTHDRFMASNPVAAKDTITSNAMMATDQHSPGALKHYRWMKKQGAIAQMGVNSSFATRQAAQRKLAADKQNSTF